METTLAYQDLLYFGYDWSDEREKSVKAQSDFIREIKEKFPNVQLEDAYNDIKGFRQEVYLEESDRDNYFSWLLGKGWLDYSFTMQIMVMSAGRDIKEKEKLEKYLSLAKKQYPESFKSNG